MNDEINFCMLLTGRILFISAPCNAPVIGNPVPHGIWDGGAIAGLNCSGFTSAMSPQCRGIVRGFDAMPEKAMKICIYLLGF